MKTCGEITDALVHLLKKTNGEPSKKSSSKWLPWRSLFLNSFQLHSSTDSYSAEHALSLGLGNMA